MLRPTVGIIGVGTVGTTFAHLLYQKGYAINAIFNRTLGKANILAPRVDSIAVTELSEVASQCDLIILTVSDDAIASVAGSLAEYITPDHAVIHVSGAAGMDILEPIAKTGAMVGGLHPAYPFSDVEISIRGLSGATFAIEFSQDKLRDWLHAIVNDFNGKVIEIPAGKKANYHAALVIASNYMVTLYAAAQSLLGDLSDNPEAIDNALNSLMSGTLENLQGKGIPEALTGPLVRADTITIEKHLRVLKQDTLLHETYIDLARLSYPMLRARGTDIDKIETLLRQDNIHASDNP